jgi:hypothetical protein
LESNGKHDILENRRSEKEGVMKKFVVLLIITLLGLSISVPVFAEDRSSPGPSVQDIVEDILYIRPLGFVRVIIEAVAFGVSLPVTAPLKKVDEAKEFLIEDPYSFTFERPLGEM